MCVILENYIFCCSTWRYHGERDVVTWSNSATFGFGGQTVSVQREYTIIFINSLYAWRDTNVYCDKSCVIIILIKQYNKGAQTHVASHSLLHSWNFKGSSVLVTISITISSTVIYLGKMYTNLNDEKTNKSCLDKTHGNVSHSMLHIKLDFMSTQFFGNRIFFFWPLFIFYN